MGSTTLLDRIVEQLGKRSQEVRELYQNPPVRQQSAVTSTLGGSEHQSGKNVWLWILGTGFQAFNEDIGM